MLEVVWQHDQERLQVRGVLCKGDAHCDHRRLARIRTRPCERWGLRADVHNLLADHPIGGVHDLVVLVLDDDVESVHLGSLRGQVGGDGEGVGAPRQGLLQLQLQRVVDAVRAPAWEADRLHRSLHRARQQEPSGRDNGDRAAGVNVQRKSERDLCRHQAGDASVVHGGSGHLRHGEARALAPAQRGAHTLAAALDKPHDALGARADRRLLGALHPDPQASELRQRLARRRGDRRCPPTSRSQSLPRHAHVAATVRPIVEGETRRSDDQQLPHDSTLRVDVEDHLDDRLRRTPLHGDSEQEVQHRVKACGVPVVCVCEALHAVHGVEAPSVDAIVHWIHADGDGVGRVGEQGDLRCRAVRLQRRLQRTGDRVQHRGAVDLPGADDHEAVRPERVALRVAGALRDDHQLALCIHRLREGQPKLGRPPLGHPGQKQRLHRVHHCRLLPCARQYRSGHQGDLAW
mmetsp:Transcript_92126/g.265824  ORF Transcript_92126/g.265824 Transcript_92126/m.265824 type:complete len:461 (+) Transcript_92126:480-1862(+)